MRRSSKLAPTQLLMPPRHGSGASGIGPTLRFHHDWRNFRLDAKLKDLGLAAP